MLRWNSSNTISACPSTSKNLVSFPYDFSSVSGFQICFTLQILCTFTQNTKFFAFYFKYSSKSYVRAL